IAAVRLTGSTRPVNCTCPPGAVTSKLPSGFSDPCASRQDGAGWSAGTVVTVNWFRGSTVIEVGFGTVFAGLAGSWISLNVPANGAIWTATVTGLPATACAKPEASIDG